MSSRVTKPETQRIEISRGDWILIRKRLNFGETRRMLGRMVSVERGAIAPESVGVSKASAYLLDWSITDANDKPIVIEDMPIEYIVSAIDTIDTDCAEEIIKVIEKHEAAMKAERDAEKNVQAGESASLPISPSASSLDGTTTLLTV